MLTAVPAHASEPDAGLNSFDYSGIEREIAENQNMSFGQSFSNLVSDAVNGKLDLSPSNLLNSAIRMLFDEIIDCGALMKNIIVIAILGAIIMNLSESSKKKTVGELGFYVTYVTLVGVLFASFSVTAGIIRGMVGSISGIMQASIPVMISMLFISGEAAGAYAYQSVMMTAVNMITALISNVVMPVIILGASIKIINYISEKDILTNLADMTSKGCGWALKILAGLFAAALSLQRISAPIINNLAIKTAKLAMNSVPVVGGALSGAVDSVTVWADAAKSGFSVALIIIIFSMCALPVLKLTALIIVYKLTAAVVQPICDPRIVKCIDAIGSFSFLLLGAGVCVAVMFLFLVMILLSF